MINLAREFANLMFFHVCLDAEIRVILYNIICSVLRSAIASCDSLPIEADVLSILAITRRNFGITLRLIVASLVYHRARSDHLDRFLLLARGRILILLLFFSKFSRMPPLLS